MEILVSDSINLSSIPPLPEDLYMYDHPAMVSLRTFEQGFGIKIERYSKNNPEMYNSVKAILDGAKYYVDNQEKVFHVKSVDYWVERLEAIKALLLNENCDPIAKDWFIGNGFVLDGKRPLRPKK